jgi:hypothetical protein
MRMELNGQAPAVEEVSGDAYARAGERAGEDWPVVTVRSYARFILCDPGRCGLCDALRDGAGRC